MSDIKLFRVGWDKVGELSGELAHDVILAALRASYPKVAQKLTYNYLTPANP